MARISKRRSDKMDAAVKFSKKAKSVKRANGDYATSELDVSDTQEDIAALKIVKFLARSNKAGKPTQRNNQSEKKLAIFQTVVNGRELSLLHLLNRKAEEWSRQQSDCQESLMSLITAIMNPSTFDHSKVDGKPPSLRSQGTLHSKTESLITESKALLATFVTVSDSVTSNNISIHTMETWDEDYRKLSTLLDIGVKATNENLKQVLGKGEKAEGAINTASTIWAEFRMSCNSDDEVEGWGKVARRTEKGIQHLVKHLPRDSA